MSIHVSTETALAFDAAPVSERSDWRTRPPFFYGWLIVAASFMALGLTHTVWYSFSVFYVALLNQFGWSRGASGPRSRRIC